MPKANSPAPEQASSDVGSKRKVEPASSQNERPAKQQKTIEESMTKSEHFNGHAKHETHQESTGSQKSADHANGDVQDELKASENEESHESNVAEDENPHQPKTTQDSDETANDVKKGASSGDAIEESQQRKDAQPSNILEKGIIYFFTRGRVSVDHPESVQDLARSYFVLRPLAPGAKITSGTVQDHGNNRLLALPKKVWPKSGQDKFMVFVEKAQTDMATLKTDFFAGSDYTTQTTGARHTPEVTPIGEGVYAITSTGDGRATTHLSYLLTIPQEVGEVQRDVGICEKGSFVLSLKNPESKGPANAALPERPAFPQELLDKFQGRGWMPAEPQFLDYANAQVLLIGEDFDSSSNLDPAEKDQNKNEIETPLEELEKLEGEDERRVQHLKGDDTVFADLGLDKKEYPSVLTTW